MRGIYSNPVRVYLVLGILSLIGILCGLNLPISLFPNSTKPIIAVDIPYGTSTPKEFLNNYGLGIEYALTAIKSHGLSIEHLDATYGNSASATYKVTFPWGTSADDALSEVKSVIQGYTASLPDEVRRGTATYQWQENNGFFAASFYSATRDMDNLFHTLDPIFTADLQKISDISEANIWNPSSKEIQVELNPDRLAEYQLLPINVTNAILNVTQSYHAGSVDVANKHLLIHLKNSVQSLDDVHKILINVPNSKLQIRLDQVSKIEFTVPFEKSRVFRTNGAPSIILFAAPKTGGNIKRMSEEILNLIKSKKEILPEDIHYRLLVNPAEFIESSIHNVLHEVFLAAALAVFVLFLFIGSVRNVITAAIEIPMSIVLAFILMKLCNMNLNLISLGGLALSAGMNVDGSVVVMENIFRHFELYSSQHPNQAPTRTKMLEILMQAVNEVRVPIIASTIASIVVFLPLIFTHGLSSAILSDLAKAVVFSHGLSAIVALILVPTVRLQMMAYETSFHIRSPIENFLQKLESWYADKLDFFLRNRTVRYSTYVSVFIILLLLVLVGAPKLPRELIGTPDSDWIIVGQNNSSNSLVRQMETQSEESEMKILDFLRNKALYTFTQVNSPSNASIMVRIKDKKEIDSLIKKFEDIFPNSPTTRYWVDKWNPSELPIPNPEQLRISVSSKKPEDMQKTAKEIYDLIQEKEIYYSLWTTPNAEPSKVVNITPRSELWADFSKNSSGVLVSDIANYVRVATEGTTLSYIPINNELTPLRLKFPNRYVNSQEDIESLPINAAGKLIPLKAISRIQTDQSDPPVLRADRMAQYYIKGRLKKDNLSKKSSSKTEVENLITSWKNSSPSKSIFQIKFENPDFEIDDAIHELGYALALSLVLIILTMIVQLGTFANAMLVFVAIPLGLIGVIASLLIFGSSLSLNSLLGVILLNGIAVANSIILVDFFNKLIKGDILPVEAAIQAGKTRIRPILMTFLTTVLGMIPIAIGLGEGGKILQPLGISVVGGLGVSTILTLFIVPALQVEYLRFNTNRSHKI